jgi:sugar O-acyltransferase (sialic acid O-acetyltransferase NeuD family)
LSGLLIAGAGGHGRVVADAAEASGLWSAIAFVDDDLTKTDTVDGWPVLGNLEAALEVSADFQHIVIAIGDNRARLTFLQGYANSDLVLTNVIHPGAVVSSRATLNAGTVVFAGAVINTGAILGAGCIVNTGAIVDHDCQLGNAVHVSPGANLAGEVSVGDCSWIGIGASVRQQIQLGSHVIVGAGSAVINDFGDNQTLVGVPASPINLRRDASHE